MLMLLWLPRSNTVLIWSQRNLDLINKTIVVLLLWRQDTLYRVRVLTRCTHPHHIYSTRRFRLATSSSSQHQIQADKEERVVNREFRIFCRSIFPASTGPHQTDGACRVTLWYLFSYWKLRRAFCPVSEMEPFSFINPAFPALTRPQWLYKRRVVNGSIPQFYFHNLRCDRL